MCWKVPSGRRHPGSVVNRESPTNKKGMMMRADAYIADLDAGACSELKTVVNARVIAERQCREPAAREGRLRSESADANQTSETESGIADDLRTSIRAAEARIQRFDDAGRKKPECVLKCAKLGTSWNRCAKRWLLRERLGRRTIATLSAEFPDAIDVIERLQCEAASWGDQFQSQPLCGVYPRAAGPEQTDEPDLAHEQLHGGMTPGSGRHNGGPPPASPGENGSGGG